MEEVKYYVRGEAWKGLEFEPRPHACRWRPQTPLPYLSLPGSLKAITFIGSLESQGAAAAVTLEEEPHLMMGADDEVWDGRTCQAVGREILRSLYPAEGQGKTKEPDPL